MTTPSNQNLLRLRRLVREMLALADEGDQARDDSSCGIIYAVLRDSGYRLRALVDAECARHEQAGKWDTTPNQHESQT